jgi:hypothetical protein
LHSQSGELIGDRFILLNSVRRLVPNGAGGMKFG